MAKARFWFSLLVVTLIAFGCLLAMVIEITAPEVMSKIISNVSERWQTMPAGTRIGIGILSVIVGFVTLLICLNAIFPSQYRRLFDKEN